MSILDDISNRITQERARLAFMFNSVYFHIFNTDEIAVNLTLFKLTIPQELYKHSMDIYIPEVDTTLWKLFTYSDYNLHNIGDGSVYFVDRVLDTIFSHIDARADYIIVDRLVYDKTPEIFRSKMTCVDTNDAILGYSTHSNILNDIF